MAALKYSVIKNKVQYDAYCKALEELLDSDSVNTEEMELLTLLIEHYDAANNSVTEMDPIELLKSLMKDHGLKSKDLVGYLGISKGYVSDILNYKKGLSKEVIRKLASRFHVSQEAFNRPYKLSVPENKHFKNASVMNAPIRYSGSICIVARVWGLAFFDVLFLITAIKLPQKSFPHCVRCNKNSKRMVRIG